MCDGDIQPKSVGREISSAHVFLGRKVWMLHIHIRITAVSQAQPAICREEVISWTIVPLSTSVRLTNFYVLLRNIISSMALRRTRGKSTTGRGMCQIGTYSKTREVYVQYRRRLKRTGATAPVLTGAWGGSHQQASAGIYRRIACRYLNSALLGQDIPL